MSTSQPHFEFTELPCPVEQFLDHVDKNPTVSVRELVKPFQAWEGVLRAVFAQDCNNVIVQNNLVNLIDVYDGENQTKVRIRGRNVEAESKEERERYVMPLKDTERKSDGQPAIAASLEEFRKNFGIFTENAFQSFDWSNVVAAGSAVTTSLASVPEAYAGSVKSKREYYHKIVAPASDIDLFIYGIDDEKAAIDRMIAIEKEIRDNLLSEAITIRTKNCVTIASQYPNRHVQIVLRLYKSISQILTGFDVNCSCVAYNGSTVFASPRALASFMTQCNDMDLSRRSPSYESRLSKYSHRGFEVYCDFLDRSRIDPTIFERSFRRIVGLARLLVLEQLPRPTDREEYIEKRRSERGAKSQRRWRKDTKNLKGDLDDEVPEWQFEGDSSSYNTFTIPYGKSYTARKIQRIFFAKDILLNAEWNENNRPPIREVKLHRHPVFLGTVAEVAQDCCGYCPCPQTDEEKLVFEEESKRYVSGPMVFLKDDPGRQEIGSFHPLDANDYTDMAYISESEVLFKAIVENDAPTVDKWLAKDDVKVNCRDHCGRTPLHVAAMSSDSLHIFQALIDRGARLIARLQDGRTALHIAAARGKNDFVNALLRKSEANMEQMLEKEERRRLLQKSLGKGGHKEETEEPHERQLDGDVSDSEDYAGSEDVERTSAAHSFVKIKRKDIKADVDDVLKENSEEPDILDINALDWYFGMSPLHHAILSGSGEQERVLETLVSSFGANVLLPLKSKAFAEEPNPKLILNLTLPFTLPTKQKAISVLRTLLRIGATCAQANSSNKMTGLHYAVALDRVYKQRLSGISAAEVLDVILEVDGPAARGVMNCIAANQDTFRHMLSYIRAPSAIESPLHTAIELRDDAVALKLLQSGASAETSYQDMGVLYKSKSGAQEFLNHGFLDPTSLGAYAIKQPLERAISKCVDIVLPLLDAGADPSTILCSSWYDKMSQLPTRRRTVLDMVRDNIEHLKRYLDKFISSKTFVPDPEVDGSVWEQFPPDSFQRYHAEMLVGWRNKQIMKSNSDKHVLNKKREADNEALKQEAETAISFFERTESYLLEKGARSYYDLYPEEAKHCLDPGQPYEDLSRLQQYFDGLHLPKREVEPWRLHFNFVATDLTVKKQEAYVKLFEAAWSGDIETVKQLTLQPCSDATSEPLLITTQNCLGTTRLMSPFFIAVIRGHIELAKVMISIAHAQYGPEDSNKKYRYTLDEDRFLGCGVLKETMAEVFAIDNMAFQPQIVKSKVSPFEMISAVICTDFLSSPAHMETALGWAIRHDKLDVIKVLLELAEAVEEDGQWRLINPMLTRPNDYYDYFCYALRQGKTSLLEMFMKSTGCGLDYAALEAIEQETGLIKPDHYLGLTVNGRKRKDWAKSVNPNSYQSEHRVERLLHLAAYSGNIDSIHWLLSERPLYCLQEFIRLHPENKRAKLLAAQSNLAQVVHEAIGLDSNILPHLTIQGWNGKASAAVLDFWFKKYPELLEAKCPYGFTPLLRAVNCSNPEAIKYIIAKGADLRATTNRGHNFVHIACKTDTLNTIPGFPELPLLNVKTLLNVERLLSCLPKEADIKEMVKQRAYYAGELTTVWHRCAIVWSSLRGVQYLLRISEGQGLEVFNEGGNLPLHYAITKGRWRLAKLYIDARPDLLHQENAAGKTPYELTMDLFLGILLQQIPDPLSTPFEHPGTTFIEDLLNVDSRGRWDLLGKTAQPEEEPDVESFAGDWDKMREVLLKAVEQYPGTRIRVSLGEVTELVHRLAKKEKMRGRKGETPLRLVNSGPLDVWECAKVPEEEEKK